MQYIEKVEKYSFWKIKEKILPILAFRKSHIWEYEEEVRALHTEKHGLFKFNSSCLNEIYYGLKTKKSDIEEIDSLIKTMSYTPKKFKMKINPATYDIIREDY